ncbi:endocuticle structural protein SgAbd-6-like [Musca vetustissima]|uniref:endocuticle structural protein SgAbd-6-like n=1 Tax=Musca vetustissima TaxID=27455 RepID=UPI002AB77D10|nr:endocuticle structural protein SgAbd-6-like [Musca vetustissima]
MFKFYVFVTLLALATAASINVNTVEKKVVPILNQGEEKNSDGSFTYYFEGADGAQRQEVGFLKNAGTEGETLVIKGSYRYIDADGQEVLVEYVADENGFQPQGTIIPKEISQAAVDAAVVSNIQRSQAVQENMN